PEPELITPRQREHGDFATNVALALASRAGRPPRDVAQAIADALPEATFLVKTEVAGPGFLNFFTTDEWLHEALREVVTRGAAYGRFEPTGLRAQIEFVSANPTGPLHVGTPATPRSATRSPGCSSSPAGRSSASTTSTTPAGR